MKLIPTHGGFDIPFNPKRVVYDGLSSLLAFPPIHRTRRVRIDKYVSNGRIDIPEEQLIAEVKNEFRELRNCEIRDAIKWEAPVPDVSHGDWDFNEGDIVLWNEKYVPQKSEIRHYIGDGPFFVRATDSICSVIVDRNAHGILGPIQGSNRLLVEAPNGKAIMALPGYFKLKSRRIVHRRNSDY